MRGFSSQSGTTPIAAYCTVLASPTTPLLTARAHHHRQPVARPERRRMADLEPVAGEPLERESLANRGRDDADLELAEAHPEADPRAAAERDVGAARDPLPLAREEALGAERMRVLPHVGQPVRDPGGVVDRHPGG